MSFVIKICGITRREDAVAAAEAGATALGFIFYSKSPRYVEPRHVPALAEGLTVTKVGIFVDEPEEHLRTAIETAGLDVVQLYTTAPEPVRYEGSRWWRAVRVARGFDPATVTLDGAEAILLDGVSNGQAFSWPIAKQVNAPVILAGGLDASNVVEAVRQSGAVGVDVSSKLEIQPGIKDHRKITEFVRAARQAAGV
jgi:phosphoribosylanthranilate isomerase